jgi:hypothetical protein
MITCALTGHLCAQAGSVSVSFTVTVLPRGAGSDARRAIASNTPPVASNSIIESRTSTVHEVKLLLGSLEPADVDPADRARLTFDNVAFG